MSVGFHGNEMAYKNGHEIMGTGTAFPWILGVIAHGQSEHQAVESAVAQKCSEWDGDTHGPEHSLLLQSCPGLDLSTHTTAPDHL